MAMAGSFAERYLPQSVHFESVDPFQPRFNAKAVIKSAGCGVGVFGK